MNLSAFLANWRTTVWGGLCILAAFITQQPQVLDAIVEPALAKKIAAWAFLITGLVTFAQSKDAAVSGNGSVDDPARKQASGRSQILPLFLLAGLSLAAAACATDPVTGRRTLDVPAALRVVGAIGNALTPQPPAPSFERPQEFLP